MKDDLDSLLKDVAADITHGRFSGIGGSPKVSMSGKAPEGIRENLQTYHTYLNLLRKSEVIKELKDPDNAAMFKQAARIYSGILSSQGTSTGGPKSDLDIFLDYYKALKDSF